MAGPRIPSVTSRRDRLPSPIIFQPTNVEYDPEREAFAAMKLDAERQRWINAALAWIELTRLRAPLGRESREETV